MKTMKRKWCLLGVFSLLLCSLPGCGQEAPEQNAEEQKTSEAAEQKGTDGRQENEQENDGGALSALSVQGRTLVDENGEPVQLRGISTHGIAWYPQYINRECFLELKNEWGANVIRLAMYTGEDGGYCAGGDREALKQAVFDGVEYAKECGMYAIIDWHILSDGDPNTHLEEAKDFFAEMSARYAGQTNVLYEICNEPNGGTTWSAVKSYAQQVIPVIRENDADAVILVGTPNWCQYVNEAAADPLEGVGNVMYTLHFYADTHRDDLRNTLKDAVESGLPVFVSEYGICDASGSGAINTEQANRWISLLDEYGISYVAWNLSNKNETSAILQSGCAKTSQFTDDDLSASGKWLHDMLAGKKALP